MLSRVLSAAHGAARHLGIPPAGLRYAHMVGCISKCLIIVPMEENSFSLTSDFLMSLLMIPVYQNIP
jgi:hypothetical protein